MMNFSKEELEIIEAVRALNGCEGFAEEECLEVWEEIMGL